MEQAKAGSRRPPGPSGLAPPIFALLAACSGGGSGGGGLNLLEIRWGRLADVRDGTGSVVARDLVVEEGLEGNLLEYSVSTNPVTERTSVTIFSAQGAPAFEAALAGLADQLGSVAKKFEASSPPYSMVPRNAALLLVFDGAVDPDSLGEQTVRLFAGGPGGTELEAQRFVDPSNPRRVVLDPSISPLEAQASGLAPNDFGLPPSPDAVNANLQLRIPTQIDPSTGQTQVLRSASGGQIEDDPSVPGLSDDGPDLVRVFRSGGRTLLTGDPNEGLLLDLDPPELLGSQGVTIASVAPASGGRLAVAFDFDLPACTIAPEVGDVLEQSGAFGLIVSVTSGDPPQVIVQDAFAGAMRPSLEPGPAFFHAPFQLEDVTEAICFVKFLPPPTSPPASGVEPASVIRLRFSEPVDSGTVQSFETAMLRFLDPGPSQALTPKSLVVGEWAESTGRREFTFVPTVPIPHESSVAEEIQLTVLAGAEGVKDFLGHALSSPSLITSFTLDPQSASTGTAGFSLRFDSLNETDGALGPPDPTGKPEIGGQLVFEPGELIGRPVLRFSRVVDPGNPFVAWGSPAILPSLAPLNPFGSRLMTLWRHVDLGISLQNPSEVNLDVERLHWTPFLGAPIGGATGGGQVVADAIARFRIDLAHSYYFPDDSIYPSETQGSSFPYSGMNGTTFYPTQSPPAFGGLGSMGPPFGFWGNPTTEAPTGPPLTVYDGPYIVDPGSVFLAPGMNTPMVPYPDLDVTYTWRDTAFPYSLKGGPSNYGVDPAQWNLIYGPGSVSLVAQAGKIPSIGLPLLLELRRYPLNPEAPVHQTGLQMSRMWPGYFGVESHAKHRLYSAGGFDPQGNLLLVDPEDNVATGGFNPASNPPGLPTPVSDSGRYWGQADFVVRVTRAFTHWFDTGATANVAYGVPVVEPRPSSLPPGTQVLVEFRGADLVAGPCPLGTSASGPASEPLEDASGANLYGVYTTGNPPDAVIANFPIGGTPCNAQIQGAVPPFPSNPSPYQPEWTADLAALNGKRFLQMRFTFVSNIDTGEVPTLSAVGVAYFE